MSQFFSSQDCNHSSQSLAKIKYIFESTKNTQSQVNQKGAICSDVYRQLFHQIADRILKMSELEHQINDNYFYERSLEQLLEDNHRIFEELALDNYEMSFANPAYAVKLMGTPLGQLFSYFYNDYLAYIEYAFQHKQQKMEDYNVHFINVYDFVSSHPALMEEYDTLKQLITRLEHKELSRNMVDVMLEQYDRRFRFYTDIVEKSELSDLRYLFKYGLYISENEIKTAKFFHNYPVSKINILAKSIVRGYLYGFRRENKDMNGRTVVMLAYGIGQERLAIEVIHQLKAFGLHALAGNLTSTDINKQYLYDHRFDKALYIDESYMNNKTTAFKEAAENYKHVLNDYAGIIYFDNFGQIPFSPIDKDVCLKLTEEQARLISIHTNKISIIKNQYIPFGERSFTIIAFPTPEIGNKFEEIFEDIMEINMMGSSKYEVIQQTIIDTLDQASHVIIKGQGENQTDIKVNLFPIQNPEKETNFYNCVADVNIPLGEVYTSPKLVGTNGILHCKEVFLDDLKYIDLRLVFNDGYIQDYSCCNLSTDDANRRFIEENLLFPHKSLPIGEFAIGTNTFAYMIAQKHNILDILPILIIEKMGPHFAIGDTCFHHFEDLSVYNLLDQKEIVARDNEKSILRKTSPLDAYTGIHTDITLPYDAIGLITAITISGEQIDIIKNGRFVLPGTEALNQPFDEI